MWCKSTIPSPAGRLKLIAAALVLLFMFSALPLAAADEQQEYIGYTIITELRGRVVDNATGAPVENVTIEGEVHSRVI